MSVDPPNGSPDRPDRLGRASSEPSDYAHVHDEQAQRARYELWIILAIVVVVLAGGFVWRAVTHSKPGPQAGWNRSDPSAAPTRATTAGAAAGVSPHGAGAAPPPRPVGP